jgi:transcriptional regulator with XRE-family HTH domain
MTALNTDLIRRRRIELRYSHRRLAAELGVSGAVIRGLEDGFNHEDVTVGLVCRLADALCCEPATLFNLPPTGHSPKAVDDPADDAVTLGAVLHASETATPRTAIVELLGWTYERLDTAAEKLDEQLGRCGLRLRDINGTLSIIRTVEALPRDQLTTTVRSHLLRAGLSRTEANLLRQIATGTAPNEKSNADTVALGVLVNANLTDGTTLTEDVAYSLVMFHQPIPAQRAAPR